VTPVAEGFELRDVTTIPFGRTHMRIQNTRLNRTAFRAAVSALFLACSGTSNSSPDSGPRAPLGATAVTDTGLVGCASLASGCFTTNGAPYEAPSVTATCGSPGGAAEGPSDEHCNGVAPEVVDPSACSIADAGASTDGGDASTTDSGDAGATDEGSVPGPCGENGPDYGATMYGTEGDDDDCKYHVSYTYTPVCQNDGTYFIVTAHYLTRHGAPLEHACAFAELCLNDTHPAPNSDARPPTGRQIVVEGEPGTYTIGPVTFDEPGNWTVRFHFNEICCDVVPDSPHGHAAFHVRVP
jgi:hypothetical protein